MNYLTEQEWKRFVKAIESPRDKAMFTIAYWRGLRASELGMIEMDDLDMAKRRIRIERLKNSYGGEYQLSPDEVSALKAWLRVRGREAGSLFTSRNGGSVARGQVFNLFQKYAALAELPADKRHPHVLKHSIATHLLDRGLDIIDVKDWLGHRAIKNTTIYAEVSSKRRESAARKAYS